MNDERCVPPIAADGSPVPETLADLPWPWGHTVRAERYGAAAELPVDAQRRQEVVDTLDLCLRHYLRMYPHGQSSRGRPGWVWEHWDELHQGMCAWFPWLADVTWAEIRAYLHEFVRCRKIDVDLPEAFVRAWGYSWVGFVVFGIIENTSGWLEEHSAELRETPELANLLGLIRDVLRETDYSPIVTLLAATAADAGQAQAIGILREIEADDSVSAKARAAARSQLSRIARLVEQGLW